jgi:hypothetical protein
MTNKRKEYCGKDKKAKVKITQKQEQTKKNTILICHLSLRKTPSSPKSC